MKPFWSIQIIFNSLFSLSIELARQNLSGLGPGLFYQNLDLHGQGLELIGANILNFKLICNLDVSQNSLQVILSFDLVTISSFLRFKKATFFEANFLNRRKLE